MILLPIIGSPCYLWDGVYIGLTASRSMRNAMFFSLVIYLAFYGLVYQVLGNHGLWLALLVFLAVRGLSQWWLYRKYGLALR
jgi:MATE family multidrug resistance protein